MTKRALDEGESNAVEGWVKYHSKSYGKDYWFHAASGEKSWEEPKNKVSKLDSNADQKSDTGAAGSDKSTGSNREITKVAIIVPFRDISKDHTREKQLAVFVPAMVTYMSSIGVAFHLYIIDQSVDYRKFNRGKLLNIGFKIACQEGCNVFIFHDVDLLPSEDLKQYYAMLPIDQPIHIASVWDRYNANPSYFGGVVSFSRSMFERINGFPNNFWGWGGEDDELYKRTVKVGLKPLLPKTGTLTDMENMNLDKKLAFLRTNKILKCMNKHEVLDEHEGTWQSNGLRDLKYEEVSRKALDADGHSSRITVDVMLNKHWTDARSGINDTQL